MTKFEVIKSITDVKKFSELVFDLLNGHTAKEIEDFLSGDMTEDELQTLESIAQNGYPLSLERKPISEMTEKEILRQHLELLADRAIVFRTRGGEGR